LILRRRHTPAFLSYFLRHIDIRYGCHYAIFIFHTPFFADAAAFADYAAAFLRFDALRQRAAGCRQPPPPTPRRRLATAARWQS
jgi:hypothetical protein